jgi:uncharacterized protein
MNIRNLQERAESGNVVAQATLGICYLDGIDVEVDYKEALRFLSAASRQRVPRAMSNLARIYAQGLGVPKDIAEAIRLYEAAAKAGEFLAQVELGRIYSRGLDVPIDRDVASIWYSAALAQEGNMEDCEELLEAKTFLGN